ncbi:universal stress protein [Pseudolysinimonas sp.]|uniref:universal stress protein n=1 Tax=Pseudolysinimonas sp. TaxID=2680009 RepID=UPI00286AC778|nr:universal stress protein [Pseudolysinimonas sp.]
MYRISVGVDPRNAASTTVDWVSHWHRAQHAQLTLVTAFDYLVEEVDEDATRLEREAARLQAALPDAVVDTAMADGSVPGVLARRSRVTDLLVIGSHRTRHARSVLTGRLPLRIAEHAACPVIVVPDDWQRRTGSVVVGLGDDESSDAAIAFAAGEAGDLGGELRVLHAWWPPSSAADGSPLMLDQIALRTKHGERLAEVARRARERCPAVREHLHEGAAGGALVALSADAALAVVGTHRTGPIGEFLVGSTAASLIRDSRTPVCVVPSGWTQP